MITYIKSVERNRIIEKLAAHCRLRGYITRLQPVCTSPKHFKGCQNWLELFLINVCNKRHNFERPFLCN